MRHSRPRGLEAAGQTGLERSTGEIVFIQETNATVRIEDMRRLLRMSEDKSVVAARAESVDDCASVKQELADRLVLHVVERCLIVVAERAAQVDVSAMGEKDLAHGLVVANDGVVEWRKLVRLEFDEPVGVVALRGLLCVAPAVS